ncbi:MAG: PQQ-dependent sugar dehydrogenase [Spirochaetes bacterium]|nr:PQQ-dependent sugar dehydrogenase [Spirochaetota bacterium]
MKKKHFLLFYLYVVFQLYLFSNNLSQIQLPAGFQIQYYAKNVITARSLTVSPTGIVYVGSKKGKIYALVDEDHDWVAEKVVIVLSGLNRPIGVDYYQGDLYISEVSRILKIADIDKHYASHPSYQVVSAAFPTDMHHGQKFIKIGPDKKLYVPIGAPCNICLKKDPRYASLMRMELDGSQLEIFAHGIRNTVGFDWHPQTKTLWFTDNGRDQMGDNLPPDELNKAVKSGLHFGYPFLHGNNIKDPVFGSQLPAITVTKPEQELGPHVAALGMRFYTGRQFPQHYFDQIFIAEHGSWNRTIPIGYRITLVKLTNNQVVSYEDFATGWLNSKGKYWGRPVDIEILTDGSLLVSDDYHHAVYRIYYEN